MQDCMGENGGSTRFGLARPKMAYVDLARLWLGPLQGAGLLATRLSLARLRAACRRGLGAAQEMEGFKWKGRGASPGTAAARPLGALPPLLQRPAAAVAGGGLHRRLPLGAAVAGPGCRRRHAPLAPLRAVPIAAVRGAPADAGRWPWPALQSRRRAPGRRAVAACSPMRRLLPTAGHGRHCTDRMRSSARWGSSLRRREESLCVRPWC